jgi:hypothetical protein
MVLCYGCGREIHFDNAFRSPSGKFIPLSGSKGYKKHRCKARPFNRKSRREWWENQRRQAQQKFEEIQMAKTMEKKQKILEVLGLSDRQSRPLKKWDSFTLQDFKNAYRKLAMRYHPDRCKDNESAAKFIEISDAYESAIEELERMKYRSQI